MPTNTTTYSFQKPVVGADEDSWGGYLNSNWDKVDDLFDGTSAITGIDINSGTIDGTVIGGSSAAAITGTTITGTSFVSSGDMTFGDSDKAIFGAGSDLQIYHDGFNSYIVDNGTGDLHLSAANFYITNPANTENHLSAINNGAVTLYYDNAAKLATTATGVDITGTLTSDGLTVDGSGTAQITSTSGTTLELIRSGSAGQISSLIMKDGGNVQNRINSSGGALEFEYGASNLNALKIDNNGDISFYEGTGTTPKFFWDASAESLGIGTTSTGSETLVVEKSSGTPTIRINAPAGSQAQLKLQADATITDTQMIHANVDGSLGFSRWDGAAYQERMRIDSSGNVGIGTTPNAWSTNLTTRALEVGSVTSISEIAGQYSSFSSNHYYAQDGTQKYITSNPATRYYQQNGEHVFMSAGSGTAGNNVPFSERMRIDSSGNLLVGRTAVDSQSIVGHQLDADGYAIHVCDGDAAAYFGRNTSDGDIVQFRKDGTTVATIGVGGGRPYFVANDGSTGGGFKVDSTQFYPVDRTGTVSNGVLDLGYSSGRWRDAHFSGTVNAANFNTTSDATLKTNVETLTGSLDAVKALRGVSFDWIDSGNSEVGVIAQEVEAVIPDVVSTNDQGIKSVKYGNLVGVLIEAIKEQQQRIEALEARLGD